MTPRRRSPRNVAALVAVTILAVAAAGVILWASAGGGDDPVAAETTTSTSTTVAPIERVVLAPGTSEFVTVDPGVEDLFVSATPPPGWDTTLGPVVTGSTPEPPRSGLDLERIALPSADDPISGRHVGEGGWTFSNPTTFDPPQPLVFGVVERQGDWIQVLLPVRPNGTTGWLAAQDTTLSTTDLAVEVTLSERRVRVHRSDTGSSEDTALFDAPIAIGGPSTPTPTGLFYVTDIVPSVNPAGGYGPVALALNGYSEVMDAFAGEPGTGPPGAAPDAIAPVLALHGTNRPDSVGRALSNGCPRLFNDDMLRLAELVPAGTPVRIWP